METTKHKIKKSLIEQAFDEIMPEVEFVDVISEESDIIAGGARKKLEKRLGRSVISKGNFLKKPEGKNTKKLKSLSTLA